MLINEDLPQGEVSALTIYDKAQKQVKQESEMIRDLKRLFETHDFKHSSY